MAVLIIPSLKGDSLEEYSMRVAEKWKVGHKGQDNGLILLICKNDRKIRIEVGYGWEGKINDARAGDIIRGMGPYFRNGKYADGISFAIDKAQAFITGKPVGNVSCHVSSARKKDDDTFDTIFTLIVLIIVILSIIFRGRGFYFCGISFSSGGGGFSSGGGSFGGGSFGGGGASGGW
jgi:uncharacterized protein